MNTEQARNIEQARNMVESLGGNYVGIQQPLDATDEPCVMFTKVNSTHLLSLPLSTFRHDTVREKLGTSTIKFHLMEFRTKMQDLASQLHNLANQIEEELKNAD